MNGGQIRRLDVSHRGFWSDVAALAQWEDEAAVEIEGSVRNILAAVRARGDAAVVEYTTRFDGWAPTSNEALEFSGEDLEAAATTLAPELRAALQAAAARISAFHQRQIETSWQYTDESGSTLGQQISALERVGMYVPGGKAAYPSSVLMNAVPAKVAGVDEIIMTVPTPGGVRNQAVLAAAYIAGVDRVFAVGGAQAIGALAYGTDTIPAVDKIVGPGNIYVATAKRLVFGRVGIDMVAGPSEIVVVCDGTTAPEWITLDLFSQAEHDEAARAVLVSPSAAFLDQVQREITRLLPGMARTEIISASLERHGALIRVNDLDEAVAVANIMAPEHLELSVAAPETLLPKVRNAGAIFLGRYASEALGDYCAGPNHVLPTGRSARFSSPLGVYDFQKRSSVIMCSAEGARELGAVAQVLAQAEGLEAHGRSAALRIQYNEGLPI